VGKKLLATGNGRCNYTNENMSLNSFHGADRDFIGTALSAFGRNEVLEFFERLGIVPASEDGGKIFPLSFQSSSMLDVLRYEIERSGVNLRTESHVSKVVKDRKFKVYLKDGEVLEADRVILATGGMAMPVSGSDGNGYSIARAFGHKVTPVTPSLVQLKLKSDMLKAMNGIKFDGKVSLFIEGKLVREDIGDVLFTDYGISGPPILQLSREAVIASETGKHAVVAVAIIRGRTKEELKDYLKKRFDWMPEKRLEEALIGMINKKLIIPLLKEADINKDTLAEDCTNDTINKLSEMLTNWEFQVTGHKGWGQAQTTAGGVDTNSVDPLTMESKVVKGLYFTGELLDVDGDCGGYNLQWAWTSGYIAGKASNSK
jgi:predicted Rossmann fold flavoprotein